MLYYCPPEPPVKSLAPALSLRIFVAATTLSMAGCGASPAMRAVEDGHLEGLRALVTDDLQHGRLGTNGAVSFARALARSEVLRAAGDEGIQRMRELRSCASEVEDALSHRADKRDPLGPAAATVLLEAGISASDAYRRWARAAPGSPEAGWRPLGARGLISSSDGELRRKLMADGDEEVRRQALRASLDAGDPADTEAVLEAAQIDPHPAARAQAIRSAGALGGERVVLALKDLWPRADGPVREAIVAAWASRGSWDKGGRREITWVVETQRGLPALAAASALVRAGGPANGEAVGVLSRAVNEGPTSDRVRAIDGVPLRIAELREAVSKAEADPDEVVAVAAMARRLDASPEEGGPEERSTAREALIARLLPIATGTGAGAMGAKGALARAKVKRIAPILERDGVAADAKLRVDAGTALAVLGDFTHAAVVAADPEPQVRTAVSCAILRHWAMK
jgi:hypothetical protein